jgi:hypothetical protein
VISTISNQLWPLILLTCSHLCRWNSLIALTMCLKQLNMVIFFPILQYSSHINYWLYRKMHKTFMHFSIEINPRTLHTQFFWMNITNTFHNSKKQWVLHVKPITKWVKTRWESTRLLYKRIANLFLVFFNFSY